MYLSAKRTAGSLNLRSKRKQSNYRKNRVFPYITLFPLEKNIESKNTDNKT